MIKFKNGEVLLEPMEVLEIQKFLNDLAMTSALDFMGITKTDTLFSLIEGLTKE